MMRGSGDKEEREREKEKEKEREEKRYLGAGLLAEHEVGKQHVPDGGQRPVFGVKKIPLINLNKKI
jgi:hypothetical protein